MFFVLYAWEGLAGSLITRVTDTPVTSESSEESLALSFSVGGRFAGTTGAGENRIGMVFGMTCCQLDLLVPLGNCFSSMDMCTLSFHALQGVFCECS